ncbi:helix-turn-helix domain-containing protein [Telluria beijingensis]|uniref:helix-turn-helix domain-containing protein n=1 Tax=Telluria beijingensis TaxID=3068633 RepID=UPI002795DA77|nr:helix-turn-helix domain-containing protein [Massilia sp. REN29]
MNDMTFHAETRAPIPQSTAVICSRCVARNACLPSGIGTLDILRLDKLVGYRRRLARDEVLFRKDQPFAMIYAVRFGHLKSSRPDHRGHPHVTGFYMAGELLGLDAIYAGRHACTTVALEDSEVCEIPYSRFQESMHESLPLMQRFHAALSHEIVREQNALLHADMSGAERLATLLLDLSARYAERGYSGRRFRLRMSRADMGNYLGLTIESISRLLGRFRDEHWIALDKREIELLDPGRLEALLSAAPGEPGVSHEEE